MDSLRTDIRYVHLRPATGYMENKAPDGTWIDEWGLTHRVIEGGYYELGGTPLAEATIADIETYPWPDPHDPARIFGLREEVEGLFNGSDVAIGAYRPTISGIFELSQHLCGMEKL
ncbi:MAG: uroporphyrinogen decarboxylase, partial [Anaerolineales bacterium]|nr:uroporphyrinogen decarboxylase [Anaerolineales bacterium]